MPDRSEFRFYVERNDFLPAARRKVSFAYAFVGTPAVVEVVEALGVAHTEIDLILVAGTSMGFDHRLRAGERVAVYLLFESLDVASFTHLRPEPLREPRFILDVHLGWLARYIRLLGFDALYTTDYEDAQIAACAAAESCIVLADHDKGLLKRRAVTRVYWLRQTAPRVQSSEVVAALDLWEKSKPFTRCIACNSTLEAVAKEVVAERLPPQVCEDFEEFSHRTGCEKATGPARTTIASAN